MAHLIEFLSESDTRVVAWVSDLMLVCEHEHNHPSYSVMVASTGLLYSVNIETWQRIRDEMRSCAAALEALARKEG